MLCCACACSCMRRFCLEMERKRVEPRSTRLGIRGSNATARLDPRKLDPDTRPLSTSATINSNPPSVIFAHQGTSPTLITGSPPAFSDDASLIRGGLQPETQRTREKTPLAHPVGTEKDSRRCPEALEGVVITILPNHVGSPCVPVWVNCPICKWVGRESTLQ
jgi:hypothetical protein